MFAQEKDWESIIKNWMRFCARGLICRNAERLKRLAEDILDVTRIESQSLTFTKERLNLNEVIFDTIQNNVSGNQIDRDNKVKIIFAAAKY